MKQPKIRTTLGVTLLELLMVITIIAILSAIGYPNYLKFKYETRRVDAQAMVLHIHSTLQNYLVSNNSTAIQSGDLSFLFSLPIASKNGYYSVNVALSSPNYTITATATGDQLNDLNCRNIIMNNNGNKSSLNSSGSASTGCW
jgi:type IV pilus assembly protein PilE